MYTAQEISQGLAGNQDLPFANFSNVDTGATSKYLPYPLYDGSLNPKQSWMESGSQWGAQWAAPYTTETSSYGFMQPGQVQQNSGGNRPGENGGGVRKPAAAPGLIGPGGTQNPESQYESAVRAFDLTGTGSCGVSQTMFESEKQSLYAGHRLFGNLRLAQGSGDLGEVLLNGKATIVNPAKLNTVVQGLSGQEYDTPDAYRDDSAMVPFAKIGGSAGGLRPELYVGTISEGLSMPVKMETMAQRSFLPNDMPTTFNIFPESEAAAARKDNVARLNRIQRNYIQSRLNAASNLDW